MKNKSNLKWYVGAPALVIMIFGALWYKSSQEHNFRLINNEAETMQAQ